MIPWLGGHGNFTETVGETIWRSAKIYIPVELGDFKMLKKIRCVATGNEVQNQQ